MNKIFITGGSGMVGRNLINYLKEHSYTIVSPTSSQVNLLNKESLNNFLSFHKPDIVIHCAGIVGGIEANIKSPFKFLSANLEMGLNIVNCSVENGIKNFINLGSSCMYPKNINTEIHESDLLNGYLEKTNEGYALAKISVAKLCEYVSNQYKYDYKTLIPCNLYGKWDNFDEFKSHMIPAAIRKIDKALKINSKPVIWGDGSVRREFMYVEDLADFILFALRNFKKLDCYTNVGLGHDFSVLDYYNVIAKVIGYNGDFEFDLNKPTGVKNKLCSVKKIQKLGWRPKFSLEEGIKETYEFYLKKYGI